MNHIYVYSTHFYLYIYLGADKSFISWWSFLIVTWCVIKGWYCEEKLDGKWLSIIKVNNQEQYSFQVFNEYMQIVDT